MTADPRGPKAFELTPEWLSDVGSIAEGIDHRPDLALLLWMGASDDGRGVAAERYLARGADRFFPRGLCPNTSS